MLSNSQIASKKEFKKIAGDGYDGEIRYEHLVAKMICNPPREECWLATCEQCDDTDDLEKELVSIFAKLDMDEVTYRQWQSTDRTELVTITESTADFVESLLAKLHVFKVHMFIHDMQTKQFCAVKENLSPGEVLIVGDFSENYSFVVQDAAQGVQYTGQTHLAPFIHECATTRRTTLSRPSESSSYQTVSPMIPLLCTPSRSS